MNELRRATEALRLDPSDQVAADLVDRLLRRQGALSLADLTSRGYIEIELSRLSPTEGFRRFEGEDRAITLGVLSRRTPIPQRHLPLPPVNAWGPWESWSEAHGLWAAELEAGLGLVLTYGNEIVRVVSWAD